MTIAIDDPEIERKARELGDLRGLSLLEAIDWAVAEEYRRTVLEKDDIPSDDSQ